MRNLRTAYRHLVNGRSCLAHVDKRHQPTLSKRAEGADVIKGYSSVFYNPDDAGTEYWLWDDMVERIQPGAFDRAIKEGHDARALFNHDSSQLLGRVSAGNTRLSVDTIGLLYEIDVDKDDPDHQRVTRKIDRGDVTGSSFAFIPVRTTWEEVKQDNQYIYIRNIWDVDLYDVGPVTWPAYAASTAGRSRDMRSQYPDDVRELIAERDAALYGADYCSVRMRILALDI